MQDSDERLHDTLRASGRRLTPQRRLILRVLRESSEHLDAETLCQQVRALDPEVSLATVYRTLAMLRELGLIEEQHLGEDHSHYEAVRDKPHYHFTCLLCGRVIEFETELVKKICRELQDNQGVFVTSVDVHACGYCADCQKD